jgi:hypothetical protein
VRSLLQILPAEEQRFLVKKCQLSVYLCELLLSKKKELFEE